MPELINKIHTGVQDLYHVASYIAMLIFNLALPWDWLHLTIDAQTEIEEQLYIHFERNKITLASILAITREHQLLMISFSRYCTIQNFGDRIFWQNSLPKN